MWGHMKLIHFFTAVIISCVNLSPAHSGADRCKPNQGCWPTEQEWTSLAESLEGSVFEPEKFLAPCLENAQSHACQAVLQNVKNPFFVEDQPAGGQNTGWIDAWSFQPPLYVAEVRSAYDIAKVVSFAKKHNIKVVVKGSGHDYHGRYSAPDALMIWTHRMRDIEMHNSFVPVGCTGQKSVPAVSVAAGKSWLETYDVVTNNHNKYVQGGGCTSVGAVGGFSLGGGFGNWSKKYGTGAGNMLEAEVITADGKVLIANACQNKDLFWALRGGGGGTFGVVSKITYRVHDLPKNFGLTLGKIQARDDAAFKKLLSRFIPFFRAKLLNESWGESLQLTKDNAIKLSVLFQGISKEEVQEIWKDFRTWLSDNPDLYDVEINIVDIPANKLWDADYMLGKIPGILVQGRGKDSNPEWWWAGDGSHVAFYWAGMFSRWIPEKLFAKENIEKLVAAFYDASRQSSVKLFLGKGLALASPEARAWQKDTSMNPMALDGAVLLKFSDGQIAYPGVEGHEPNKVTLEKKARDIKVASEIIRKLTPDSGSYANEADYFEPNWQQSFWGPNYSKLLDIKRKYDPDNFFTCHHCIGSEN